jgi:hypothetical protein
MTNSFAFNRLRALILFDSWDLSSATQQGNAISFGIVRTTKTRNSI